MNLSIFRVNIIIAAPTFSLNLEIMTKVTTKDFLRDANEDYVYEHVTMENFDQVPWYKASRYQKEKIKLLYC